MILFIQYAIDRYMNTFIEQSEANIQYAEQIKLDNDEITCEENIHCYDGNSKGKASELEIDVPIKTEFWFDEINNKSISAVIYII